MRKKKKRVRKVPKDKDSGLPKRYLTGLKGSRRTRRANLIKRVASIYKSGGVIPISLLRARTKA
tara:strand:+ start:15955 stop:16146 length:192 start_codon:yes stop_codon:yes gene_type:complete